MTGLSFIHPEVAAQPELAQGVLIAALLGSHAPDFDTVVRLKSYNHYIRFHRGITHSLPALLAWPALIALPVAWLMGVSDHWLLLFGWTMLAVVFHVFLDWLNAYGVQCLRPFDRKWRHQDILPLFDPFLFTLHGLALAGWLALGLRPEIVFPLLYGVTFGYIGWRAVLHLRNVQRLKTEWGGEPGVVCLVPGLMWYQWQFIVETEADYITGTIAGAKLMPGDRYSKAQAHPAARATLDSEAVKAFIHLAERVHVQIAEEQDGFEVQWRAVRFWHNNKLAFGVNVRLDSDMQVLREQLFWNKKLWEPPYV